MTRQDRPLKNICLSREQAIEVLELCEKGFATTSQGARRAFAANHDELEPSNNER
jgi:hypothetical protein